MIITYHGSECFKVAQGDLALVINPSSKMSADVTLFSNKSGLPAEALAKAGFVIDGPGEYEVKDIFIKGFLSKIGERYATTYLISFEGMKLCFLAGEEAPKDVEDIDILFVPVGAYKAAVALEPSVMIPMNYTKESLDKFLKEAGEKDVAPLDKLVVKKKDLEGKEGEVLVLKEE